MLRTVVLAVLLLATALPVSVGFKEGVAAYWRGDYRTAFREFKALTEQGDPKAQFALGVMYANGQGVPKNYHEAVKWFMKAAEQGNAMAQSNLGFMLSKGLGVPRNYTVALMWFSLSAAQGNNKAARNIDLIE